MADTTTQTPDGIDVQGVTEWFGDHVEGCVEPLSFRLIAGGHSNLTFEVTDSASGHWVLRRPPLGQVLASAHDMGREHTIISGAPGTDVPVPRNSRALHRRRRERRAVLRDGLRGGKGRAQPGRRREPHRRAASTGRRIPSRRDGGHPCGRRGRRRARRAGSQAGLHRPTAASLARPVREIRIPGRRWTRPTSGPQHP